MKNMKIIIIALLTCLTMSSCEKGSMYPQNQT